MRLLEIIPTPETDRAAIEAVAHFCDVHLGKGVVYAKDTPNFIANRIGTFSVLNVMRLMQEMDLSIEDVDALTGTPWDGRSPRPSAPSIWWVSTFSATWSATWSPDAQDKRSRALCRLLQQDARAQVAGRQNQRRLLQEGQKAAGRQEDERLALDWKTLEYRPRQKPKFPALEMAKNIEDPASASADVAWTEAAPQKGDKAGAFLWAVLSDLWNYSANRMPEISDSIVEIDRAMHLGFNWELGPFELWDAAGVEATVARMKKEGQAGRRECRETARGREQKSWYRDDPKAASGRAYFDLQEREAMKR